MSNANSIPLGILIALLSCLTGNVLSQQRKCLGTSNYCPGQYGALKAVCKGGYCVCTGQEYDYTTCLPDAFGCRIEINSNTALGKPLYYSQQPRTIYSCAPGSSSTQYEVHVMSVYEGNRHTRPPSAGDTNVNIVSGGKSGKPIVLVFASYEPVNWILHLPAGITISKVILVAYYIDESSVSGDVKQVQVIEKQGTRSSQWNRGYGKDTGGGDTVGLLRQIHNTYGVVTSFTGTYKADQWSLTLSSQGLGFTTTVVTTPATTTPPKPIPTTTPKPTVSQQKCLGSSNYCPGQYGALKAVCKGGYCFCTGQDYDYNTCLPDAFGCRIEVHSNTALAKAQYNNLPRQQIYSCTPGSSSTQYEVHILAVHRVISTRPPSAGDAIVNIISSGQSGRPIVLVFASYQPVNWILNLPAGLTISKVILVAYYIDESSVSGDVNQVQVIEKQGTRSSQWNRGYGKDTGGGDTVGLLRQVHNTYGVVTSFTGTYKADQWSLTLSSQGLGSITTVVTTPATTSPPKPIPTTTPKPTVSQQKCLGSSNYCPGQYGALKAVCKGGYCFCTGQHYDYNTCLPDAFGCRIELYSNTALAKPQYNNQPRQKIYSCTPGSSSTQYEVHVLSVYQVINTRPPSAGDAAVNIVSGGQSGRPIVLVFASYEPVNWILHLPAGITISKVILVAYYIDESSVSGDVNQVQVIEKQGTRSSQWSRGYGKDTGGGDTVGLLREVHNRFGVVTSFTGTYKADQWSLTLSSQGLGFTTSVVTNPTTTAPPPPIPTTTPKPTLQRQKCDSGSNYCPGSSKMSAVCKDGYCVCTGKDYDYNTCLPDAYECRIIANTAKPLAPKWPRYNKQPTNTIYSCQPVFSSAEYEVHVLSVYEVTNTSPPSAGNATVKIVIRARPNRPIILVLGSYEPVNWILDLPTGFTISKVILVSYYVDQSSVSGDLKRMNTVEKHNWQWGMGYGSDSGGGDTVALLKQLHDRYGVVTSFTGTYKADEWSLVVQGHASHSLPSCH